MAINKLALVFPGQGSQTLGMLTPWLGIPIVEETLTEASEAISIDLRRIVQEGPAATLNSTLNTQPIIVATSVAFHRAWLQAFPESPAVAAGHSVGEYSALVAAGSLDFGDAIRLVRVRAQAMASAMPDGTGGMAAVIGLDDDLVRRLCRECANDDVLEPANFNAPGQVVVAGHLAALERLRHPARKAGAKMVMILPVSGPFHSSLMAPAAAALRRALETTVIQEAAFDVIHNVDLQVAAGASIAPALVAQLTSPVRWTETVERFLALGVTHVIEIGPGSVLTNLAKRIAPSLVALAVASPSMLDAALAELGTPACDGAAPGRRPESHFS